MRRDRRRIAAAAVVVIALGAAARFGLTGTIADVLGGVFYAGLIYLLAAFVAPGARPGALGAVAAVWCLGVEFWQLTGTPAAVGREFPPLRLVLGSGFAVLDLVTATAGVLAAVLIDRSPGRSLLGSGRQT